LGAVRRHEKRYRAHLEALPPEPCKTCGGTGRAQPPQRGPGSQLCNACDGTGRVVNFAANYPFSTENVREFVTFLRDCGGFRIC
jgi:DnaJ-class molecular chaperone